MSWWVYILCRGGGTLYTGTAADVERRLTAHRQRKEAKYIRDQEPLAVVYREECPNQGMTLRREAAVGKYRRAEREALISDYAERRGRMKKTAFIGMGSMNAPLIQAACRAVGAKQVVVANHTRAKAEALAAKLGCAVARDSRAATAQAEYTVLYVRPQMMEEVLSELAPILGEGWAMVSIAAGLTCETLRGWLAEVQGQPALLRVIPNAPAAVGEGILALCAEASTAEEYLAGVEDLLAPAGRVECIIEGQVDAFSAVAGYDPVSVYPFIGALIDGGVKMGLPREQVVTYAAQVVLGATAIVLESGKHPRWPRGEVCSPGGSTITGAVALEERGFRSAAVQAVEAAFRCNQELGKV